MTELTSDEDKWLDDYKDGLIDPIVSFMKGPNKAHLDEASRLLNDHKANLSYVQADEIDAIKFAVVDPNIYKGKAIQTLTSNIQSLKSKLDTVIAEEKAVADAKVDTEAKLTQYDGYLSLSDENKAKVQAGIDETKQAISDQSLIAMIRDAVNSFENDQHSAISRSKIGIRRLLWFRRTAG